MLIAPEPRAQLLATNAITPALKVERWTRTFAFVYRHSCYPEPLLEYKAPSRPIPSRAFFPSTPPARRSCFLLSPIYPYLPSPSVPPSTCRSQHLLRATAPSTTRYVGTTSPATNDQVNMYSTTTPCSPAPLLGTLDGRITDIRETFRRVGAISDALAFNLPSRPCAPAECVRRRFFQPQTRLPAFRRVFLLSRRVSSLCRVREHVLSRVRTYKRVRSRSTTRREPRTPPLHLRARGTADRPGHASPR
ncbi:hypothetical protein C8Q73DRAFT_249223 [Cubamyces lactineus]|nr:hypothetical protein C8Q73DRAFT_249223 [Cubamyces lactineus]